MKRNTSICIFLLIIFGLILLFVFFGKAVPDQPQNVPQDLPQTTEKIPETENSEAVIISSKEETDCAYLIRSDAGRLSVYLSDGCTLYLNTGIAASALPEEMQEKLTDGIRISTEQELMDFLESYSS